MKYTALKDLNLLETLTLLSPESSKTTLKSWIQEGRILIDDQTTKDPRIVVLKGQTVSLAAKASFIDKGIRIYFSDSDIVVIEKPTGLLTVATAFEKTDTAHAILKKHYHPKPVFVVHRLDQETSGVMMFALNQTAAKKMKALFEKHAIERCYNAVIEGKLEVKKGVWDSYLFEDEAYKVHVTKDVEKGERAITHYEVIQESKRYSLLKLKLETGKKNQIRVHCQEAGHPVVGDKKYGALADPLNRLGLHACLLAFVHPITGKSMRFESKIPEKFETIFMNIKS